MKIGQEIKLAQRPFFRARIVGAQRLLNGPGVEFYLEWSFPLGRKVLAKKQYGRLMLTPVEQKEGA